MLAQGQSPGLPDCAVADRVQKRNCEVISMEGVEEGDSEFGPPQKRPRMQLGAIARHAIVDWGLDEDHVAAWAARRGLPGIGITDPLDYRLQHPDVDLAVDLTVGLKGLDGS